MVRADEGRSVSHGSSYSLDLILWDNDPISGLWPPSPDSDLILLLATLHNTEIISTHSEVGRYSIDHRVNDHRLRVRFVLFLTPHNQPFHYLSVTNSIISQPPLNTNYVLYAWLDAVGCECDGINPPI